MNKEIKIILLILGILIIILGGVFWYFKRDNEKKLQENQDANLINQNANHEISNSQKEGILGKYDCLSKFQVKKGKEYSGEPEILELDFFQPFDSGAFFGKIKNYQPGMNKKFAFLINQLMQEKKITTYLHLEANICLYRQDLLNPENGAGLNYYIEHYYCTNSCQTGKYEMKVDLDSNGNFVGYRTTDKIY